VSHVAECKTVLKSLSIIEKAAQRLGGSFHRDQHTYAMYGQGFVDDSTDWRTLFEPAEANRIAGLPRAERIKIINKAMSYADHVITFPKAQYGVGVVAKPDGTFRLRWDYYSQGGLIPYMGDKDAGRFTQAYGIEAAKQAARARGYATKEVPRKDGSVALELMVR